jgi:uncharacterized membrane protein YoaK (UPF0700 family)
MGLQNAMVTKLSGARIRTTHLTGITTDIGIEAVRLGYAFADRMGGLPFWRWPAAIASAFGSGPSPAKPAPPVRSLWNEPDFVHLRLHASIWLSFLTGAFVGTSGYVLAGHFAVLFPCAILVVLAGYDLRLGLTESRHAAALAP